MRIIVLAVLLALAACSPDRRPATRSAGHSAGPSADPSAGRPAGRPPTPDLSTAPAEPSPRPAPGAHRVTFSLRGAPGRTSVTYTTPGGRREHDVVSPPWNATFNVRDGESLDVRAHRSGGGELTCTLRVDGELVKSASSSGDSATVECGDEFGE